MRLINFIEKEPYTVKSLEIETGKGLYQDFISVSKKEKEIISFQRWNK